MRIGTSILAVVGCVCGSGSIGRAEDPIDKFRKEFLAVLAAVDAATADKPATKDALYKDLTAVVEKYSADLRPGPGEEAKTHATADKSFVLVIAAHGLSGEAGGTAAADDPAARVVVSVAGNGGPSEGQARAGRGGMARAKAEGGIGIALGGQGGAGRNGQGSGGGAGAAATGKLGSVGLGGPGGPVVGGGGKGGASGGTGIQNPKAVAEAAGR